MNYLKNLPTKENAVAYCHNPNHLGYLSANIMRNHKCLKKNCIYLHKYEEHPYWHRRRMRKNRGKFKKWLLNDDYERIAEYIAELIGEHYEQVKNKT